MNGKAFNICIPDCTLSPTKLRQLISDLDTALDYVNRASDNISIRGSGWLIESTGSTKEPKPTIEEPYD